MSTNAPFNQPVTAATDASSSVSLLVNNKRAPLVSTKVANAVKRSLDVSAPVNLVTMGDSTGTDSAKFAYRLTQQIASLYPSHTVSTRLWNATNEQYDLATLFQVGSSGLRYFERNLVTPPGPVMQVTDSAVTSTIGDLDVRCQINLGGQGTLTGTLCGKYGAAGQKSWRFELDTGQLVFAHTSDGTTEISRYSGIALTTAQKTNDIWLRATLDVDNGAAGNTVKFYTSTAVNPTSLDWTQLGATSTLAGVTSVFDSTTSTQFCGRGGNTSTLAQTANVRFYAFIVYGSIDETLKVIHFEAGCLPLLSAAGPIQSFRDDVGNPAAFYTNAGGGMGGSPRCAMFNGSTGGQVISYSVSATRYEKQIGSDPSAVMVNYGHNEGTDITYRADYKALTDKLLVTNPDVCIVAITQNTRLPIAGVVDEHRVRMDQVAKFALSQNFDLVDTYRNWPIEYTRTDDGTHPTAVGLEYWAQKVMVTFGL